MAKERKKGVGEYSGGRSMAWSARGISQAVDIVVMMQLTYFCTNALGLSAGIVGSMMLISRLFDGVSDLVAGIIVDKTHTRWGKARPYELCIIGVWATTVLLFSCPNFGTVGKTLFVFLAYTLNTSVFVTLESASEPVYLRRAFKTNQDQAKILSTSGILVMIFSTITGIALPLLISMWGTQPGGWTKISLVFAIPFGILGTFRFLFIKEMDDFTETADAERKVTLKEALKILFANKYILIYSAIMLLQNLVTNIASAVGLYYAQYILGNLALNSILGMIGLFTPFTLVLVPKLMQKRGLMGIARICTLAAAVGYLIKIFGSISFPLLFIASVVVSLAALPLNMLGHIITIECIDYGEWKNNVSGVEGIYGSLSGFAIKIGGGLASAVVGIVMGCAGFDGTLEVQSAMANGSIIALSAVIPAVLCLVQYFVIRKYDLNDKIGQIRQELDARRKGLVDNK